MKYNPSKQGRKTASRVGLPEQKASSLVTEGMKNSRVRTKNDDCMTVFTRLGKNKWGERKCDLALGKFRKTPLLVGCAVLSRRNLKELARTWNSHGPERIGVGKKVKSRAEGKRKQFQLEKNHVSLHTIKRHCRATRAGT